jgi:succinoglycan biosynthesis protein ExoA
MPGSRGAPDAAGDELVTVVVPARNEEKFLGACLDSILAQDHEALQVIVVDGDSTDRTAQIVRDYAASDRRVELLSNPERIIPISLNLALQAARSRWLVRVDAHATIPGNYVSLALQHLRSGRWVAVGGRKDGVGVTPAGRAIAAVMGSRFGVGNSTYHYGTQPQTVEHIPFGAYDVEVARAMGGWDPRLRVNQDFEFDYRLRAAGHELLFDPRMTIDWYCRQTVGDLFRQYERYGRGKVTVALMHPRSMRVRHLVAPTLVAALAAAAAAAPRRPALAVALAAPYAVVLAGASAKVAGEVDEQARRFVAPAFLAMHVGWGIGFWRGLTGAVAGRAVAGRGSAG